FTVAVLAAGGLLVAAASTSTMGPAVLGVASLGVCAGFVYVLGFTLLHENVGDEMRCRAFGALYTLVRLCVLSAFLIGPFLSQMLDSLSQRWVDRELEVLGVHLFVPGVRLTLWLAGAIIVLAGLIAAWSFRAAVPTARHDDDSTEEANAGGCRPGGSGLDHRPRRRRGKPHVDPAEPARRTHRRVANPRARRHPPRRGGARDVARPERHLDVRPGRGAAVRRGTGPARPRGDRAGARRGPPRRHRPLRRLVVRLPGLRPGARPGRGPSAV